MSPTAPLRVAVLGCGRMGQRHALNVAYRAPRAVLVAVVDINPAVGEWVSKSLPASTVLHTDPQLVFDDPKIDAVVIATETATHADLAIRALQAGKHVLLEKPIALTVEDSLSVITVADSKPNLKTMIGLSRRFDESIVAAKARIDAGMVGTPYMIKSATNDAYDPSGFFVRFSKQSGGIFLDCGIHDIDMSRWLLDVSNPAKLKNPKKQVTKVYATGLNARHPELAQTEDCDNGTGIVEYENGTQLMVHLSRTVMHGHDCYTEVFGTESQVIVNRNPTLDRLEIRDQHGVRQLSTPTYNERFREAFANEINGFVDSVLDNTPVPVSLGDALEATRIAMAMTASFRTGQPVLFGEDGLPIMPTTV